ncbi:unnamed protein product [Protopolystoma xenopodis]|uniref:Uncharacterized protein n=1 Tax=Protopolystoma xenopodis TaxID=117903 RepID=A0A448XHZ2_9PLAT|nr:unnamed protein product [Protopolystoma xenopodis]
MIAWRRVEGTREERGKMPLLGQTDGCDARGPNDQQPFTFPVVTKQKIRLEGSEKSEKSGSGLNMGKKTVFSRVSQITSRGYWSPTTRSGPWGFGFRDLR